MQLFHTRYALHKRAYQHRVGAAVELMLLEVMLLADPYLKFAGTGGQLRRMSECPGDMAAYWQLSDCVLKQIETSYAEVCSYYFLIFYVINYFLCASEGEEWCVFDHVNYMYCNL